MEVDLALAGDVSMALLAELAGEVTAEPAVHLIARGDGSEDFARKYGF